MSALGFWLLRRKRIRVDAKCPHGTFVPGHRRLDVPGVPWGCAECGFTFSVHVVAAPRTQP